MFLTKEQYEQTMQITENAAEAGALLSEFSAWFYENYRLKLYNYFCDCPNGLTRLQLVLWDFSCSLQFDNDKWRNPDERKRAIIACKFAELCRKYGEHPDYQTGEKIFICFESLSDEIEKRVIALAYDEVKQLDIPDLWRIYCASSSYHIFFETDAQVEQHKNDGVCDTITKACDEIVKRHDEYNVFERGLTCWFTSHQTLREKYDNNLGHYWIDN